MGKRKLSGSREIQHRADWALEVWSPDLETLFQEAAMGMIGLMGIKKELGQKISIDLLSSSNEIESLLVAFLEDIRYLTESERLAPDQIAVHIEGLSLVANLSCGKIVTQRKEIKAVTFHNLAILWTSTGFRTQVVFDV